MEISQVRLESLRSLIDTRFGGSQSAFSRAVEKNPSQVWQYLHGNCGISEKMARQIEYKLSLPTGYLDNRGLAQNNEVASELKSLPVSTLLKEIADRMASPNQTIRNILVDLVSDYLTNPGGKKEQLDIMEKLFSSLNQGN